jgi:hypothetical protein
MKHPGSPVQPLEGDKSANNDLSILAATSIDMAELQGLRKERRKIMRKVW